MINNPAIKLNSTSKSNLVFNNIVTRIHMVLALIVIAWMNNGFFTYAMPYVPNFIRYGLYFAWLGLALVGNRDFQKFIKQTWPLLLFLLYVAYILVCGDGFGCIYQKHKLSDNGIFYLFYYFNSRHIKFQKLLSVFLY